MKTDIDWELLSSDFKTWRDNASEEQILEFDMFADDCRTQFNGICGIQMGDTLSFKDRLFIWSIWLDTP